MNRLVTAAPGSHALSAHRSACRTGKATTRPSFGKSVLLLIVVLVMIACGDQSSTDHSSEVNNKEPTVAVRTVPLRYGRIDQTLTVYGVVIPSPDKIKIFSVPFESVIEKEWVNVGEAVETNDRLLTLTPSPDTRLRLQQARIERNAAREQLGLMRERVRLRLATKQDLVATDSRFEQAREQLQSLTRRGLGKAHEIRASAPGIVYLMNVRQGQIAAAGMTLLQTVDHGQLTVRFGVEPEDIDGVHEKQLVRMKSVHNPDAESMKGHIHMLTHLVDPKTRLVRVLAQPSTTDGLLLNDYIEGRIVLQSKQALLAPRTALLPAGKAYRVFTVKDGRAIEHQVRKGLQTDVDVEIIGEGLQQGEALVTVGNYQLRNGSAVRVEPAR
jgi:membrane fusion protein, multidrug efflux system